jgi:hypothetical protein
MRAVFLRLENNDFTHFCLPITIIDLLAARALCASDPGLRAEARHPADVGPADIVRGEAARTAHAAKFRKAPGGVLPIVPKEL